MAVRDVVQAAAGVGGAGEYIEDLFSTYLYTGNGGTQTINNGIDLDGEGGLVWTKSRSASSNNALIDTVIGRFENAQSTNLTAPIPSSNGQFTGFLSNGYSLNQTENTAQVFNVSSQNYASWTFRKAPKFFDVVTWTGNNVSGRQIPHNLGSVPGCIIVKNILEVSNWEVWHRGVVGVTETAKARLNSTASFSENNNYFSDNNTSSDIVLGGLSLNELNKQYIAYVFAHDAGGFGDDGEQNVISCGSYTGNTSSPPEVDLGFEPQWLMIKNASVSSNWMIIDSMRGIVSGGDENTLAADNSAAENGVIGAPDTADLTATGFQVKGSATAGNSNGHTHIYIAIRRPMKTPESGTEVFANSLGISGKPYWFESGFPVDLGIQRYFTGSSYHYFADRLRGQAYLSSQTTDAEATGQTFATFDFMEGWHVNSGANSAYISHMFRRAPGFMDVVATPQTAAGYGTVTHNLGVAPEFIILKGRDYAESWRCYHAALGRGASIQLNLPDAPYLSADYWGTADPTATEFGVRWNSFTAPNYIAYVFASLPGVSKVSSYTGTGADLNVDCGFSAGARFVLIKRTDSSGDWYVWDSARGIVSGNDPYLRLNSTAAEVTSTDYIDPLASGFTVTSSAPAALNASGGTYIFLAIA